MRRRLAAEDGVTLVELLIVCALLGIVMAAVINLLISGSQAQRDTSGRVDAQQGTRLAIDRLEYEARCASSVTSLNSGAGVALVLPAVCSHATGNVSWCVTSGALTRYAASSCTGTGQVYVSSVTSATPFTVQCATGATGYLPRLRMNLSVNDTSRSSNSFSLNDTIALRNGGMDLSATSGAAGSSVTVTGSGLLPSHALTITFGSLTATITSGGTTSATGAVSAVFTVPFTGGGTYPVTVSDGTTTVSVLSKYTVTGTYDGLMFTSTSQTAGVLSCGTVGATTNCVAEPLGSVGNFTGKVTLETSGGAGVTNTGSALTISCTETTLASPGATTSPASSTIANGSSTTAGAFTITGLGAGWQAQMRCTLTLNGGTTTLVVTANA
jgi:prepilin-type N-terminal cleavage/methylation domain-containing protein